MIFSIIMREKVKRSGLLRAFVALTGLLWSLQEQTGCKLQPGACFKLVASGFLIQCSTLEVG